jgi:hypothetical protein
MYVMYNVAKIALHQLASSVLTITVGYIDIISAQPSEHVIANVTSVFHLHLAQSMQLCTLVPSISIV